MLPKTRIQQRMGRPRMLHEPCAVLAAYVPISLIRAIRRLGDGNMSAGVRRMGLIFRKLTEEQIELLLHDEDG